MTTCGAIGVSGHSLCSPLATCRSWADRSSPYRGRSLRNTMAAAVAQSLARMEAFRVTWRTARATVSPAEAAAGGRPAAEPREEARPAQPGPDAVSSLPLPLCLRAPGLAPSRCPSPPCWVTPRWRLGKRRVGTRAERLETTGSSLLPTSCVSPTRPPWEALCPARPFPWPNGRVAETQADGADP